MTDPNEYGTTQTQAPPPVPPQPPATGAVAPEPGRRRSGGGVATGLILVFIGVALLVTRVVPSMSFWALWPFFVIVPGLIQAVTPGPEGWGVHRFFDGLTTVAIGLILLGNTTGVLAWGVWWQVLMLWPVLLISAGLGLLGKSLNQSWIRSLGSVVVIAALAYAAATSYTGGDIDLMRTAAGGEKIQVSTTVNRIQSATFNMVAGVGTIDMGSRNDQFVTVDGTSPFGDATLSSQVTDDVISDITFQLSDSQHFVTFPGAPTARIDAKLSDQPQWNLVFDTGAATLDADLSDLDVRTIVLRTGASRNTLKLGKPSLNRYSEITARAGVATVDLLVPRGIPVRVEASNGLVGTSLDPSLRRVDDGAWETADYQEAFANGEPLWLIHSESGVGSFSVKTY